MIEKSSGTKSDRSHADFGSEIGLLMQSRMRTFALGMLAGWMTRLSSRRT